MSKYDSFKAEKVVDETALKEFKKKYDENIIQNAEDVISSATSPIPSTDIVGTKALYQMLGGITFGQDDNGRWGYRVGASSDITPFGNSGYNGFHGIIWGSPYVNNVPLGQKGPESMILNSEPDILEYVDDNIEGYHKASVKILDPCKLRIKAFSNCGFGQQAQIASSFTVRNWKTGQIISESTYIYDNLIDCEGNEEYMMNEPFHGGPASTSEEKASWYGGYIFEVISVDKDYVYKPIIMNNLYVKGNGLGADFHQSGDTKYSSVLITGLDNSATGFFIGNGGTTGGSYGPMINNISLDNGTIGTVVNGSEAKVRAYFGNSESTACCGIAFKFPNTFLEGKTPICLASVGGFISNHYGSDPVYRNYAWTVSGIREGHNGFVIRTGDGSTYVNGIELKSNKSIIVKNGDVVITYLGAGENSECTGYAFVIEV